MTEPRRGESLPMAGPPPASSRAPRPGPTVPVTPLVVRGDEAKPRSDAVAAEEPLEIRVEGPGLAERSLGITMRTPGNDFELAVGMLVAEGIVRGHDDVERVQYCVGGPQEQRFNIVTVRLRDASRFDPARTARASITSSACGVCGKATLDAVHLHDPPALGDGPVLDGATVRALPAALRSQQRVFDRTGGLHAAGVFDAGGALLVAREDVGRHNAVDKAVGWLLLERHLPATDRVLQVSGRASYEIVQKAIMAGIGFVAAVGAPSSLAVSLAAEFGATLVAFVNESGFNVYTGRSRVAVGTTR